MVFLFTGISKQFNKLVLFYSIKIESYYKCTKLFFNFRTLTGELHVILVKRCLIN